MKALEFKSGVFMTFYVEEQRIKRASQKIVLKKQPSDKGTCAVHMLTYFRVLGPIPAALYYAWWNNLKITETNWQKNPRKQLLVS